jgi:hypothetical protein
MNNPSEVSMLFLLFILALFPTFSFAEMTKIVIEKREPFAGGHEFGVTGAYEKIIGRFFLARSSE